MGEDYPSVLVASFGIFFVHKLYNISLFFNNNKFSFLTLPLFSFFFIFFLGYAIHLIFYLLFYVIYSEGKRAYVLGYETNPCSTLFSSTLLRKLVWWEESIWRSSASTIRCGCLKWKHSWWIATLTLAISNYVTANH